MISDGRLNLSTACVLSSVLNRANSFELLKQASGKSRRDVEAIVGRLKRWKQLRERITPVTIGEPAAEQSDQTDLTGPVRLPSLEDLPDLSDDRTNSNECKKTDLRRGGKFLTTPAPLKSPAEHRGDRFELRFSVNQDVMMLLEKARKIAPGSSTLESVFGRMLREYLERHDPAKKQERREKRKERAEKATERKRALAGVGDPAKAGGAEEPGAGSGSADRVPDRPVFAEMKSSAQPHEHRSRHIPTPADRSHHPVRLWRRTRTRKPAPPLRAPQPAGSG